MSATTIAQIAASVSNILVVVIIAIGYYKMVRVSERSLDEMYHERVVGGRPLVIAEANYRRFPEIDFVVRNVGGGPAKEICFDFSAPIKSSTGFVLSDLYYLSQGMEFLGPESEMRCLWDDLNSLTDVLRDQGLHHGIRVEVSYKDLRGESFRDVYEVNPLLYEGIRNADRKDMEDLVEAVEKLSSDRAASEAERAQSSQEYEAEQQEEDGQRPDSYRKEKRQ